MLGIHSPLYCYLLANAPESATTIIRTSTKGVEIVFWARQLPFWPGLDKADHSRSYLQVSISGKQCGAVIPGICVDIDVYEVPSVAHIYVLQQFTTLVLGVMCIWSVVRVAISIL